MIGYVMVGTNNLDQSIKFYDELLEVLDLERTEKDEVCAGYSQKNSNGKIEFYVTKPFNKEKATVGNGSQISFQQVQENWLISFMMLGLSWEVLAKDLVVRDPKALEFTILTFVT